MSIKNGFHYDDYNRRYYRDAEGSKIEESICLCAAHELSECCCDCTSWGGEVSEDWLEQLEWEEHQRETSGDNFD